MTRNSLFVPYLSGSLRIDKVKNRGFYIRRPHRQQLGALEIVMLSKLFVVEVVFLRWRYYIVNVRQSVALSTFDSLFTGY